MNQSGMNQGNDKMASKQRTGKLDVDPEDGSYEDDFEKELESELSDEPRGGATSKGNTSSSAGRGRSQGPAGRTVMSHDNFFDAAEEVGYDSTPDSGVHESLLNMDPEQRARLEEEWRTDLAKTEDEIQTLRSVLLAKVRHSQELKRKLGITVWREFREDWEQGFKNVKESDAYQKTETVLKTASEKTTTVIGTFSASVTKKIGEVKNSPTFKSFEEKVGSAYTNVKTKVSGSRSNSMQSFEEALANAEGRTSTGATPSTTPMIPEEKPLS